MKRLLLLAAALGSGAGAYWSLRLAYGEILYSLGTAESVARAEGLAPGDAQYGKRGAELAEAAGLDAEKAGEALEAVLRDKPGDAETLIKLGLRAEMRNDFAGAERSLLEAARQDRGYDPRWSLANYYFRRQEGEKFWKWARAACETGYGPALFRLLWNYTEDSGKILDRAIAGRGEILRQYLEFLSWGPHWESGDAVAKRILERPETEDAPALLGYCDRLLEARRGRAALELWNALGRGKLSGFGELDPERGPVNGEFATSPTNRGFDWRLAGVEGVTASHDMPGVRLSFSGAEPEACEPLWQYAMLEAGARYQMRFAYATSGVAEGSGLRWRVEDLSGKAAVIAESEDLAHEGWREGAVEFTTPAGMLLGRVVLSYRRAPGTTRTEGSIGLRSISIGRVN